MFKRFVAMQTRRPVATCLVTGASVMSIGDSAVQLCGSGTLDVERNVVVSAYNAGWAVTKTPKTLMCRTGLTVVQFCFIVFNGLSFSVD